MKKFWKDSWAIVGYIWGVIGTLVTIMAANNKITIGVRWLVVFGFLFISAIVITIRAAAKYQDIVKNGTRYSIIAYEPTKKADSKGFYYTDFSKGLRVGTFVAIYYTKPISKKIGYGRVCNESIDEYKEIEVIDVEADFNDIFEQSKTNAKKVLQDMYILPNLYVENIDDIKAILDGGKVSNG